MSALLSSVKDDREKLALYLNECRRMGIQVLPPDVNQSRAEFAPVGSDIRFGLTAIKNVGVNVVESVIATRTSKGKFTSFVDFLNKVDINVCNKRLIESLIKAGAFDSLGQTRMGLMNVHAEAVDSIAVIKKDEAAGFASLFDDVAEPEPDLDALSTGVSLEITTQEWKKEVLLSFEREMLGLYVSDHPLLGVEHILSAASDVSIAKVFEDKKEGESVTIAGLITSVIRKTAKSGAPWATITLEDLEGAVDVIFFAQTYQLLAPHLQEDNVVVVRARVDRREENPKLIGNEVTVPELTAQGGPLVLSMNVAQCTPDVMKRLGAVFSQYPGTTEVRLRIINNSRVTVLKMPPHSRVTTSTELFGDLKVLLGPACLS
jgi:DNA polymerase-3 subunit alpha